MNAQVAACVYPDAPCHLLRRGRLNVSLVLDSSNAALRRSQAAIDGLVRVTGLPQLGEILGRLRGCRMPRARRSLDLLAHANSDGHLVFGTSLLAPGESELDDFVREHRDAIQSLGFVKLRLLGCYTGADQTARKALSYIGDKLDVAVYGCTEIVDEHHFDVNGFAPKWEGLLVRA